MLKTQMVRYILPNNNGSTIYLLKIHAFKFEKFLSSSQT